MKVGIFMNPNNFYYIGNHTQHKYLEDLLSDMDAAVEEEKEQLMNENFPQNDDQEILSEIHDNLNYFSSLDISVKAKNTVLKNIFKPAYFEKIHKNNSISAQWQNIQAWFKYSDIKENSSFINHPVVQAFKDLDHIDHTYYFINIRYTDTDFTKIVDEADSIFVSFQVSDSFSSRDQSSSRHSIHTPSREDLNKTNTLSNDGVPDYCDTIIKKIIYYIYHRDPIIDSDLLPENFLEQLVNDYETYKPIFNQAISLLEIIEI